MTRIARFSLCICSCACAPLLASPAWAQLRIGTYNAATDTNPSGDVARAGMSTVLQGIGIESINGIQRPLDILSLQETTSSLQGASSIVTILNNIYGAGTYARSTLVGASTDQTTQAVIFNTHTVQLISTTDIAASAARDPMRFEFRPVGYDSTADFYLYSNHYTSGSSNSSLRTPEAQAVRSNADSLGAGAKIIFSGDFNVQNSSEPMYQALTGIGGTGRAFDPINTPGNWHANSGFAALHSQATNVTGINNLTGGGLDDRFDFQLSSSAMQSGQGVSYIGPNVPNLAVVPAQNSYHVFGNNGTVYNSSINAASNTALPASQYSPTAGQPTRTDVLNALSTASDHLPVIADYQIPAKMSASVGSVPAKVILGSTPSVGVSVSNVAPVAVSIGADELTYVVAGTGDVSGLHGGTALALAAPNVHNLSLATDSLGAHSGSVSVTSSSASVANGTFNQLINYDVLDHSAAEFVNPTAIHTLNLDFGTLHLGQNAALQTFQITNLAGGFRAGLDLTGFTKLGDNTNRFSSDVSLFSDLLSGLSTDPFHASFATDQLGSFSTTYLLNLADSADVFGGTGGQTLALNLTGAVIVPEPASWMLALLAAAGALLARRGRRIGTSCIRARFVPPCTVR